jgi:hypothetical protein
LCITLVKSHSARILHYSSRKTMVQLNLKLERQQRFHPIRLLAVTLIIIVLISSLSQLHNPSHSDCSSDFVHNDVATALRQFLVSSPAVMSTSSLASQQSYDLFNDIPDQRWVLTRERAHEEHTYVQKNISSMPKPRHDNPIIEYLSNLEVRQ